MTGLCGWIDAPGDGRPPEAILSDMSAGLLAPTGAVEFSEAQHGSALTIKSWKESTSFHVEPDIIVALEGYPYWSSRSLKELAAGKGPAVALAAAFRDHGTGLFSFIHGSFAFAIVDRRRRTVIIAIDRAGIHPMCFAELPGKGFVFGSTADAVRAHPGVASTITAQAVFNYLNFYVSPAPKTIYREQRKLLIGQYALYTPDGLKTAFYSTIAYPEGDPADIDHLSAELEERLQGAVRRSLESESGTKTGGFLSGGLDSSTVCGLLGDIGDSRASCFTIGFEDEKFDERTYAQIAARHFDLDYHDYVLSPRDTLDLVHRIAATYDEPFGNSSAIPTFYCAKLARECGVALMLAGDGGDEIFAGNSRYAEQAGYELYTRIPSLLRECSIKPLAMALGDIRRPSFFNRLRSYILRAETPLPERLQCWAVVANTDAREMFGEDVIGTLDADEPNRFMRGSYDRATTASSLQRMLHLDLQLVLADGDLRKVSKMCNLAGVRVKFPMLDEELVEFSARIPPSLLLKGRKLRYFYKYALRNYLPQEVLTKKKHGFGTPFDGWTGDSSLRQLISDSLTDFKTRGYLKPSFVDRLIEGHHSGAENPVSDMTWDIMALELWMQAH